MQLVTGYTGTPHVTAQDDSIRNVMLGEFGGKGVFPILDRFAATAVTANEVRVSSGYGINQGRLFKINRNDYDSCIIENGTAGYKRVDLIVARYTRDEQTGIENCELVVIKGTPNANAYVDPQYNTGVILDGDLIDDMLMYRVKLDGVTVADVEQMFTVYNNLIGGIEPVISAQVDRDFNAKLSANQQAFDQMLLDDDTAFETWFAQVQAYLDEDTAARLTAGMVNLNSKFTNGDGTGPLTIANGGTGGSTVSEARNNLGLGNTDGALPIENGGTGANTATNAVENLWSALVTKIRTVFGFNASDILPLTNGGTGANSAANARTNLGVDASGKVGSATVGSATQPIYLASGTPTKITYTIGKSVPSNAVFTDTKATFKVVSKSAYYEIEANSYESSQILSVANPSGYLPLGIMGFDIANGAYSGSGANCSHVNFFDLHLYNENSTTTQVITGLRNRANSAAQVKITYYILYAKSDTVIIN